MDEGVKVLLDCKWKPECHGYFVLVASQTNTTKEARPLLVSFSVVLLLLN